MYVLLCIQWKTPDDGHRNCPKHVEFYSKNKFEKLVHLVGFIIRIYHDARSPERQAVSKSIWHIIAACTVKNSWWWTEELSKTCRVLFQKQIWEISAFCSFCYKNLLKLFREILALRVEIHKSHWNQLCGKMLRSDVTAGNTNS